MKLQGTLSFDAPRDRVWAAFNDPQVIARHLPGCDALNPDGEDVYRAVLKIGVGPIKGTYNAILTLSEKQAPESYTLQVEGSGKPGYVKGGGQVRLAEDGDKTTLVYEGDLQIGGLIARVGQRIVGTISGQMANRFFESMKAEFEAAHPDNAQPDQ